MFIYIFTELTIYLFIERTRVGPFYTEWVQFDDSVQFDDALQLDDWIQFDDWIQLATIRAASRGTDRRIELSRRTEFSRRTQSSSRIELIYVFSIRM